MISYIEERKDQFVQSKVYERRNETNFKEGSILKSLAFTNDSKHLVASLKDSVSVYSLNGWEPMTLNF